MRIFPVLEFGHKTELCGWTQKDATKQSGVFLQLRLSVHCTILSIMKTISRQNKLVMNSRDVKNLFDISSKIADAAEHFLEDNELWSADFARGIRQSVRDYKRGAVREISSLRELVS